MNFNDKISELKKAQDDCIYEGESINDKIEQELLVVQNQIITKYNNDIKESYEKLQNVDNELYNLYKIVELCSVFDEKVISQTISELVSIFEGVDYVYQYTRNYTSVNVINSKYSVDKRPKIIISEKYKRDYYYKNTNDDLDEFVKNGHALILVDNATDLQHVIQFYRFNKDKCRLEECANYGNFKYVKEFIDSLISYKMDKNVVSISKETINVLKLKFICSRSSEIRKKYELRDKIKEENAIFGFDEDLSYYKEKLKKCPKISMPKI